MLLSCAGAASGQAEYPRVTFLADIAANNANSRLAAIQADMRSNLTAYFAPVNIVVGFLVLQVNSGRKLLSASLPAHGMPAKLQGTGSPLPGIWSGQAFGAEDHGDKAGVLEGLEEEGQRAIGVLANNREPEPAIAGISARGLGTRQLLQGGSATLQVNVTFPTTSQSLASTFNQALQSSPTSVLGGFEQGWGSVGVTSVAFSYVTASDSGLADAPAPPATASSGSADGSVGTFVGIAVAAVLGLTILAGSIHLTAHKGLNLLFVLWYDVVGLEEIKLLTL